MTNVNPPSDAIIDALTQALNKLGRSDTKPNYLTQVNRAADNFPTAHTLRRDNYGVWLSLLNGTFAIIPGANDLINGTAHGPITDLSIRALFPTPATTSTTTTTSAALAATDDYNLELDQALGSAILGLINKETITLVTHLLRSQPLASVICAYLKRQLRPDTTSWRQAIRNQIDHFVMGNSERVPAYISRFATLISDALEAGITMDDEEQVRLFLRGLSSTFDTKVAAIETLRDAGTALPLVDIQQQIRVEENRHQSKTNVESSKVRQVSSSGNKRTPCAYCKKSGHTVMQCMKLAIDIANGKTQPRSGYKYEGPARIDGLASHLVKPGHVFTRDGKSNDKSAAKKDTNDVSAWA